MTNNLQQVKENEQIRIRSLLEQQVALADEILAYLAECDAFISHWEMADDIDECGFLVFDLLRALSQQKRVSWKVTVKGMLWSLEGNKKVIKR